MWQQPMMDGKQQSSLRHGPNISGQDICYRRNVVNWTTGFEAILFNSKQNLEEVMNTLVISYVGVWRTWTMQLLSVIIILPSHSRRMLPSNLKPGLNQCSEPVSGAAPCFHLYQRVIIVLFYLLAYPCQFSNTNSCSEAAIIYTIKCTLRFAISDVLQPTIWYCSESNPHSHLAVTFEAD